MVMSVSGPGGERDEPQGDQEFQDAHDGATGEGSSRSDARGPASGFEETGELALGDEDVRLPWLESDDDDEFDEGGYNGAQVIALVVLGLIALGLIGGGLWWAMRDRPDAELVADGATIEAPKSPYKTRPANPGGEVVAGTGDTSFAVAEGETRQVRMGDDDTAAAKPGFDSVEKADTVPVASASSVAAPSSGASADVSGAGVQVGAYSTRESAEKGWTRLSQQYQALSGMRYRIVEGRADIGTVYRLQAVPGDAAAAGRLCDTLKSAGLSCQVKR